MVIKKGKQIEFQIYFPFYKFQTLLQISDVFNRSKQYNG
jgi:hypothetical protein